MWLAYCCALAAGVGSANQVSDDFIANRVSLAFLFVSIVTLAGISGPMSSAVGCGQRALQLLRNLEQMQASPSPSFSISEVTVQADAAVKTYADNVLSKTAVSNIRAKKINIT